MAPDLVRHRLHRPVVGRVHRGHRDPGRGKCRTGPGSRPAGIADEAAIALGNADTTDLDLVVPPLVPDAATSDQTFSTVYDEAGRVLLANGTVDGEPLALPAAVIVEALETGSSAADVGIVRVQARAWENPDLGVGVIAAAQALRVVDEANLGLRWFLVVFGIIALLAATIGAWLMAGRALRPIQQLAATTDAIGVTGDLSQRLPEVTHDDEVGALTESFNSMLRGIEQARAERDRTIASQQQFIADASHELRSPLTSIRANAGFLLDQPGAAAVDREAATEDIATEADRMGGLIDGLLTLARSDADGHAPPTDLVDLAHVLDVVERRARNLSIDLATDNDRPVLVRGDDNDLAELVWILVDNATVTAGNALGCQPTPRAIAA